MKLFRNVPSLKRITTANENMKYIIFSGSLDYPIIFPEHMNHSDVARGFKTRPVSAGFCSHGMDVDGEFSWSCWGKSTSLNLACRPAVDSEILNRTLRR